jgi:hypothetical protein
LLAWIFFAISKKKSELSAGAISANSESLKFGFLKKRYCFLQALFQANEYSSLEAEKAKGQTTLGHLLPQVVM